jgi:hypothetical protein
MNGFDELRLRRPHTSQRLPLPLPCAALCYLVLPGMPHGCQADHGLRRQSLKLAGRVPGCEARGAGCWVPGSRLPHKPHGRRAQANQGPCAQTFASPRTCPVPGCPRRSRAAVDSRLSISMRRRCTTRQAKSASSSPLIASLTSTLSGRVSRARATASPPCLTTMDDPE